MKSVKIWAGVLTVVFLAGGVLSAQEEKKEASVKTRGSLPPHWGKLGLSDEQKQKVYATRGHYQEEKDALRAKLREIEKKEKAELGKILTTSQKARLREIAAEKVPSDETAPKETKKAESSPNPKK